MKYPNPADPFEGLGRGTSPLGAAAKSTDVDNAATSFLKKFFDKAVVPFGLLKTKQKMLDTEVLRIRERLRAQYGGEQNWGDVMILDADAEYQRLGLTMQEMTFDDLDARNEARICMVLKVPPIIVGAKVGLDREHVRQLRRGPVVVLGGHADSRHLPALRGCVQRRARRRWDTGWRTTTARCRRCARTRSQVGDRGRGRSWAGWPRATRRGR